MALTPLGVALAATLLGTVVSAQLTDVTQTPSTSNAGIKKSLIEEIGAGRGDVLTPGSSLFIINRDPARAIARGRQLFQRKFRVAQGLGPRTNDGIGDIEADASHGAGLADSCAACHARPFGSAGFGGNVFTRPNSRDAPHLFGLGLQEMLADEITKDLRFIQASAISQAALFGGSVTLPLISKGIDYGFITAHSDGSVDTSAVEGVDLDLRVRPFFAQGGTVSMREFLVGAFNAEMGLEAPDVDLIDAAVNDLDVISPSGMMLTGSIDELEGPPATGPGDDPDLDGVVNEIDVALVDFMEFYLLNYFRPGIGEITPDVIAGFGHFNSVGCATCHVTSLTIENDRRVADVSVLHNPPKSNVAFNQLYGTASTLFFEVDDGSGLPTLKVPNGNPFLVFAIFTDFKRHDLGANFHEKNFDGSITTEFMTEPLWGVGSTPPYGHDGRSNSLDEVIQRHGGEALASKLAFNALTAAQEDQVLDFLRVLVLFSPPDTASNLDEADPTHPDFPFVGAGSIDLSVLFGDPLDKE